MTKPDDPKKPITSAATNATESPKPNVVKADKKNKLITKSWLWITIAAVVLIVLVSAIGFSIFGKHNNNSNTAATTNVNTVVNDMAPRHIDGVLVPTAKDNSVIEAVMIENEKEARPPSGLDKASIVYEALAEGGITRFMGIFPVDTSVAQIGPVRSARPYFITEAEEYDPLYVHAGGSPQALAYIRSGKANIYDFTQFSNGGYFIRDSTRPAPHNLYTNSNELYMGFTRLARNAVATYTPWMFKDEAPLDTRPTTIKDLVINFSSFTYKVTYKYDRVMNRYQRYQADAPHVTRDGSQIYAKDIVVEFVKTSIIPGETERLQMGLIGTGKMLMFRDGTVVEGTWKKDSNTGRTEWSDQTGNQLSLNPGQIWVELVPENTVVTY